MKHIGEFVRSDLLSNSWQTVHCEALPDFRQILGGEVLTE